MKCMIRWLQCHKDSSESDSDEFDDFLFTRRNLVGKVNRKESVLSMGTFLKLVGHFIHNFLSIQRSFQVL